MKILKVVTDLRGVIIDCDGTLHNNAAYMSTARQAETNAIALQLGVTAKEAHTRLTATGCRTRTESVIHLGLQQSWWNTIRLDCYRPAEFLHPDLDIRDALMLLASKYCIAIASNNPRRVTVAAVHQLGLGELTDHLPILGPDDVGVSKHDPTFFRRVAAHLKLAPYQCVSLGDREEADGLPAIAAGCGAIIITARSETLEACRLLAQYACPFEYEHLAAADADSVVIHGITGRAGSGKTSFCRSLRRAGWEHLPLDAFFKMSSRQRKAWLAEGARLGPEEYAARADQLTWWDFDRAVEVIETLRQGQPLHLRNVYNREDNGELTGCIDIIPRYGSQLRVAFDGVAIAHLKHHLNRLTMLHAPAPERYRRLRQRDADRRQSEEEAQQRFRLTESFEDAYFQRFADLADLHVYNGNGTPVVLRNQL